MPIIETGIFTLFERFPDRKTAIRAQYSRNPTFRTLCEDHRKCREAVSYWSRSEDKDAALRLREYEDLMWELEDEITAVLGDHHP